jgi:hypothetical protein
MPRHVIRAYFTDYFRFHDFSSYHYMHILVSYFITEDICFYDDFDFSRFLWVSYWFLYFSHWLIDPHLLCFVSIDTHWGALAPGWSYAHKYRQIKIIIAPRPAVFLASLNAFHARNKSFFTVPTSQKSNMMNFFEFPLSFLPWYIWVFREISRLYISRLPSFVHFDFFWHVSLQLVRTRYFAHAAYTRRWVS